MKLDIDFEQFADPIVPENLIKYTSPGISFKEYLKRGAEIVIQLKLASYKYFDRDLSSFKTALDFGCGSGRIMRFLVESVPQIWGCDTNRFLVDYCNSAFPTTKCYQNEPYPPLKYPNGFFDFIWAFSVFSHLPEDVERLWLKELNRIGHPGSVYMLTVHGDWYVEKTLSEQEQKIVASKGFYFKKVIQRKGASLNFPEYYQSSYHSSNYIREHWSEFFEIVDVIKGDNPGRLFPPRFEGTNLNLRPIGQDLIILKYRAS